MKPSPQPESQIQFVTNFDDLLATPFGGEINAIGWQRELRGDFSEIVEKVELNENIVQLSAADLLTLELSEQGGMARRLLLNDLKVLQAYGADPVLNVIRSYDEDDSFPFFPTDVYSFHVDRSTVPSATFLCTYFGEPSDILPNAQATQKILVPEIRERLRELYDGADEGFDAFLSEYFFDLHYQPSPNARAVSLGLGNVWRLAIDHPGSLVAPCIHRAPKEKSGRSRLLLIC